MNGVATVLQCIMISEEGKISPLAYELMSKMLQTLTLSYPDRHHYGPKVQVLFTNLSKFNYKISEDDKEDES